MAIQIKITPSVGKSWTYLVDKPLVKIGRASHCDVVINNVLVSREHCQLQLKADALLLEDLNSVNGTIVNGKKIDQVMLHPGDKVRLGLAEILIEKIEEEKTPPPDLPKPKQVHKKLPEEATGVEKVQPPVIPSFDGSMLTSIPLVSPGEKPPVLLILHPDCGCIDYLLQPLESAGVVLKRAESIEQVESMITQTPPDCILLCNTFEDAPRICQEIKSHPQCGPIVLLLQADSREKDILLLKSGADELLSRSDPVELHVRLRNLLELNRLRRETTQLSLQMERRVSEDVSEVERITRLKRYLSPQVVSAVLSGEESHVLKPTRQEVSIVFSDLRNFTHFSETSEPEEIMSMLSDFHSRYGEIIFQYDGTLERFAGDGVMVFFGAPVPFKDHASRAVAMAVTARERLEDLREKWKKLGYALDVSFGIATGFVYVGNIGFEGRMDYAAIGKTTNLAARLCAAAKGGEILINRKTLYQVEHMVDVEEIGALEVKGFSEPITAYNVVRLKTPYIPAPVTE
jgi:adenylate cyclase